MCDSMLDVIDMIYVLCHFDQCFEFSCIFDRSVLFLSSLVSYGS